MERGKKHWRLQNCSGFCNWEWSNWDLNWSETGFGQFISLVDVKTPYLCIIWYASRTSGNLWKDIHTDTWPLLSLFSSLKIHSPTSRINNLFLATLKADKCQHSGFTFKWNASPNFWKRDPHRYEAGIMQKQRETLQ